MFAGFNLKTEDNFDKWYSFGEEVFKVNREQVKKLADFTNDDGSLDGTMMQENWFPQIKTDIFISHSHNDKRKAIGIAGWLHSEFGLNVFIDSCVWGYVNDLLKIIDDKYCLNVGGETYNYDKRNYSTSHIHMMLSTALTMMIDKTESIFFLNTPNSITSKDIVEKTESPWIYFEIAMTKLVRNRNLSEYRKEKIEKKAFVMAEAQQLKIKYNVNLDNLVELNNNDLKNWHEGLYYNPIEEYPLDKLYEAKGLIRQTLHE